MTAECFVCGDEEVEYICDRCHLYFCSACTLTDENYDNGPACPNCAPIVRELTYAEKVAASKDEEPEAEADDAEMPPLPKSSVLADAENLGEKKEG